ncbi:hypothetical protein DFP72DRAFT_882348 [Ephemerocybe angulata]|uniref:Uncharacterized protein n=1 Tax=Ephemerocybe angulata TaxID=980116 RepID=A0A8H6I7T9_9AGAR|nr:hypothetical protein DFP72DRAFT_882348 [Tulosesus angulatus]
MTSNTPLHLRDLAVSDEDRSNRKTLHFLHESSLEAEATDSIEHALGMQRGDLDEVPCVLPAEATVSELLEEGYALGDWALLPDMDKPEVQILFDLLAGNCRVPFDQRQYLPPIIHKPGTTYTYTLLFWPHIVDIRGPNGERCLSGSQRITSEIHPVCALAGLPVFLSFAKGKDSSMTLREKLQSLEPDLTQDLLRRLPDLCRAVVPEWLASIMVPLPSLFFKERPAYRDNETSEEDAERRETLEATIKALKAQLKRAKKELATDFPPSDLEILRSMKKKDITRQYAHVLNRQA